MKTKITLAFLALFMLAGCNTTKKTTQMAGMVHQCEETSLIKDFEKHAGNAVWFAFDSSSLSPKAKEELERQACWLSKHPEVKVTVEGHCDERGTREYNLALGERRAAAAKQFLANKGIAHNRLNTISYGKDKPAMIGNTEEAFSYNRRAVTVLHK
ncbi:peptidoglycan-associated lipoprotein Pal [Rickettsia prowazekii]|uniref:Peptidoglycan-associated lipoprotein n=2 Tax=Rickettsia prowazekii TaxID=782 RepID=Q9ZCH2_RICPR|nr:peptidoglycan-associated lipoprotein Pal [Rickettsia prowazekii]EOB10308.1 3-oxoacyl-[acyl-carrier-protein] synthase 3 [Rickettsia prowazekii str. GvF12]ADE30335.1 Peptidoglycan-associated lipoprotein precursor [Rickettsia prowazekii str. Rp22]AFE49567.1 peptidoglycan-associated lipoprotein precursor [Rickettsia prowazekii str. Chernikova]AFE50411.1 peptidoglycan-associated lipoprotein precursor [Rickettsia prowazekii str. Katsinyian]AFE51255.1 peptidoglycan-associated lipoprotein precursor